LTEEPGPRSRRRTPRIGEGEASVSVIEKARPGGGEGPGPQRARRRGRRPLLILLVLAAALAALWWLRSGTPESEPVAPAEQPAEVPPPLGAEQPPAPEPAPEPEVAVEPATEPEPAAEPAPAETLPKLGASDGLVRDLAGRVSSHPLFVATLKEAGLIDRFVLIVDNLAEGNVPRRELAFLKPSGRFLVLGPEPDQRIDPASYPRYDALAAAIASLDAQAAVAGYRRVAALCEESYRALGYPEGGFEQRIRGALALLLSTPALDSDPAVVPETMRFEFADPALESLTDAQKQLLRMGPANAKRVTAKLREIQAALGASR
jgi:hypothetical protein